MTNGTASGSDGGPYDVTLQAFRGDDEVTRWTNQADSSGAVLFDLITATDLVYVASTVHHGVRYFGDPISASNTETREAELTVYDLTSDPTLLRLAGDNMVVLGPDGDSGTLRMMQVTTVENAGDRTFVGSTNNARSATMRLPLPDQAFDVEAMHDPGSLVLDPDTNRLFSTRPVLPGREDLVLTYRLLYRGSGHQIRKEYPYPAETVRLLVPEDISPLLSEVWTTRGRTEVAGAVYETFELLDGVPDIGARVSAQLVGLPISAGERSDTFGTRLRYGAVASGAVAIAAPAAYGWYWSRRRREHLIAAPPATRSFTIEELTTLQLAFETGEMSETEYRAAREQWIVDLRRQLEEDGL